MSRALTSIEQQYLDRIRDRMAAAARDLAVATRSRRELEAELREAQHAIASPDGINSSEQSMDNLTRIRRELQSAIAGEREADITRSRLSAQELQVLASAASVNASGPSRADAQDMRSNDAGAPTLSTSAHARTALDSLQRTQVQYQRASAARVALEKRLGSDIRKTMLVVFLAALFVAAIADILSIVDAGWVVSWIIPGIVWFLVRQVTGINRAGDAIVAAHASAKRQLTLLQQRLRPAIQSSDNAGLLLSARAEDLSFRGRSYVPTFVRDTIITQLIELIPIIDWLPLYIGQVVKVFVDQNIAYQKVKKLMPNLQYVHQQIELLEQFEIWYLSRQIAATVRAKHIVGTQQKAPVNAPQQAPTALSLAPRFAT